MMPGASPLGNTHEVRIAQIHRHVTIFELLSHMGVDVPEMTHQIKCPFHDDSSPSARIYADQNKIYCFTEQRSWDVIDAAQTHLQGTMEQALTWLETEFNVPSVLDNLVGTIRTQLISRAPAPVKQTVDFVEQRIRAARMSLGFERYTRLLMALDHTVYAFTAGQLRADHFSKRVTQILQAVPAA